MKPSARVTIGVPLYANADTVAETIASLQAQDYADFRVICSDDCSPDNTADVCAALIADDPRFRLVRQPVNLRYGNFEYLLQAADTEFFMWAAGDDRWAPDFLSRCIAHLDAHPGCVLAVPQVEFQDAASGRRWLAPGTFALQGEPLERLCRYLQHPWDNSRMYGLMRTAAAQPCFPAERFHAYDWGFSAMLALQGNHDELPGVGLWRDKTPSRRYVRLAAQDSQHWLDRCFPIWRMSVWLLRQPGLPPQRAPLLRSLLALNWAKHREYVDHHLPWLYRPRLLLAALKRRLPFRT